MLKRFQQKLLKQSNKDESSLLMSQLSKTSTIKKSTTFNEADIFMTDSEENNDDEQVKNMVATATSLFEQEREGTKRKRCMIYMDNKYKN